MDLHNQQKSAPVGTLVADPAVLKVKLEIPNSNYPPDPGRNRPTIIDFLRKMIIRTLPRTPRGRGDKNKLNSVTAGQMLRTLLGAPFAS